MSWKDATHRTIFHKKQVSKYGVDPMAQGRRGGREIRWHAPHLPNPRRKHAAVEVRSR